MSPSIVYVFPEVVWPYNKMVALKPSITLSITSRQLCSNICWVFISGPYILSFKKTLKK